MKLQVTLFLIIAMGSTPAAERPEAGNRVFRDAATHEQLVNTLRESQQKDPMLKRSVVEGEDPSVAHRPADLLEQSDIISFGGYATLVPKRAILSVPDNYKKYLKLERGAQIIGWKEFYAKNRAWVTTIEVTRVEAEGNQAMGEETQDRVAKSRNLVVATCFGGPISVLPLKEPAETASVEETSEP